MSKATYSLRLRTYPNKVFVSLWLVGTMGQTSCSLMWGELLPVFAEEIISALGLPVVREEFPENVGEALTPLGCVPLAKQGNLFKEES